VRRPRDTEPGDAGYATLIVVGLMAVLITVAGVLAAAGAVVAARHRAEAVADVAALAAAQHARQGELPACAVAAVVIKKNDGEFVSCRLDQLDAVVVVGVRPPGRAASLGLVKGRARAGHR
jgi:secretion/DNA translocation related TadE-like protein